MIDSSFMTTLPDTWAINSRFIMLPINRWNSDYERVLLGGLTCDSDDYYNSEQHSNAIYLPKFDQNKNLYIGFFNTGAYQDSLGGLASYTPLSTELDEIFNCIPYKKLTKAMENDKTKKYFSPLGRPNYPFETLIKSFFL